MKFWDSSAIVPLCVEETAIDRALALVNRRLREAALNEGFRVAELILTAGGS